MTKINTITTQQLIIQDGCQKGLRSSNAGHSLSQSNYGIIIQYARKKKKKSQKQPKNKQKFSELTQSTKYLSCTIT